MTAAWIRRLALVAAALLAAGTGAPAALADTANRWGTQYYVDCAGGSDSASGLGAGQAWKSLAKVNSVVFAPGSRIVFKRGTRCDGTFAPKGSGTAARPITTGAYGTGAKPGIDAHGALAAVLLHNVEHWELRDLDLTDQGPPPGESELRIGVYVLLEDFGVAHHIVVSGVDVHDVNGCDCRNPHTPTVSGGIVFKAGGTTTPSGFDDVVIEGNTIKHVDRQGIATSSDWERRAQYPDGRGTTYVAITRLRIAHNYGEDLGGDAVGVYNATGAVVEGNTFRGWAERAPSYTAALSAFNADGTVFRYNEVSYGHGSGPLPSAAYMTEHANLDTVFEHNLSRENQGGMLVVCADAGRPTDRTTIRYNISQNDFSNGYYPDFSGGTDPVGVITVICLETGRVQVYGNTVYAPNAERLLMNYTTNALEFTDNIFVGRAGGSQFSDPYGVYDHNLYRDVTPVPAGDAHAVVADPRFTAPGQGTGGYRLRAGSPALSAGAPNPGVRDYFGYPVPRVNPSIGAYTGPGVR
ncbi:right-handed parallel beta-helix repeat-containing protein [Amycolatopsis eburnea]|uniref:Uncharacterized protein n=1 Tax=Amycolatopsis eburnea TaxID=2267691 RepID=A0A3R9E0K8_9PSEU|nr:right-handed parallel beta-helix repeat-containing protein [Amycolatopsis eburnea]RSD19469.1 hypothetical protein EIY87_14285 [Amycolatopsis eburnea]